MKKNKRMKLESNKCLRCGKTKWKTKKKNTADICRNCGFQKPKGGKR